MTEQSDSVLKVVNPFAVLIGLRVTRVASGTSECTLNVTDALLNPGQIVHGGVIYSLADTGMGAALYSDLAPGETCATVEIKIAYFRPVTAGTLTCNSRIVHRGRTIAGLESEVENDKRLVAKASGTFYVLRE